jgi:hypothetical protein
MKLPAIILSTGFVALLFVMMLMIKTDVQTLLETRTSLISEKEVLQENIRVLKAEYAYLIRPDRLIKFSAKLNLQPIVPEMMDVFMFFKEAE